jgi:hypothetical protein
MRYGTLAVVAVLGACGVWVSVPAAAKSSNLNGEYLHLASQTRGLYRMMECVMNRDPVKARFILDQELGSETQRQSVGEFFEGAEECLGNSGGFRSNYELALGTLAEELMSKDGIEPIAPSQPVLAAPGGGTFEWRWQALSEQRTAEVFLLGRCLVRRHFAESRAVLSTKPTTSSERRAFNNMKLQIADCIPASQSRILQPMILRAAIAYAFYQSTRETK